MDIPLLMLQHLGRGGVLGLQTLDEQLVVLFSLVFVGSRLLFKKPKGFSLQEILQNLLHLHPSVQALAFDNILE